MAANEFIGLLKDSAKKYGSIACVGLDPVLEKIPIKEGDVERKITKFYTEIVEAMAHEDVMPAAFKPNYAFYAQYGFPGLRALENIIGEIRGLRLPLILDGKRADIGKTSAAYAEEAFGFWKADAVTVAPYMGSDSVRPFIEWCEKKGKGAYVLNRTSNTGASDFQDLSVGGEKLFVKVSKKIVEWGANAKGNVGAVVGATSPAELREIAKFYSKQKPTVPMLIPGVGAQGGSAEETAKVLRDAGLNLAEHRISSSGAINYAYEKMNTTDYAGAAVKALKELNREIGFS